MSISEIVKVASAAVAALAVPLVVTFVGHEYSTALKERELQVQFVKIAVDILASSPTSEARNIRD